MPKIGDKPPGTAPAADAEASGGALVVRAAPRGGVPVHYPQLTDTNYGVWSVKMRIIMRTLGCWSAIDGKGEYDQARDEDAFIHRTLAVTPRFDGHGHRGVRHRGGGVGGDPPDASR